MTVQANFLSFALAPVATVSTRLRSPFSSEPDDNLREAQRLAVQQGLIPGDFCGRVGILLQRREGLLEAFLAFDSVTPEEAVDWEALSAADVWPRLEDEALPETTWVNGTGETKSLREMLAELFAPFPDRDENHGGREQRETRAKWRGFMAVAARSPSVSLLAAKNRGVLGSGPVVGLAEWWSGASPVWQIRHDGSFIAPRSGARYLFDWMLRGLPHEDQHVVCRETEPVLPILYEDEVMVAVNKPARLASVIGGRETVSAESLLNRKYGKVRVVHRLDMGTSGVLVFAKDPDAHRALNAAFRAREVEKHYVARLEGRLDPAQWPVNGEIRLPLMLDWFERPKQCVFPVKEGGRDALTRVSWAGEVQTLTGIKTLVNLYPVTGRTHQLRVHCAHVLGLGMAIDGDPFYAREGLMNESSQRRLCLHAAGVRFLHPLTGSALEISAPAEFPNF